MVQRSFGVTNAAGVRIVEKQASASIEAAQLGTTAYTGVLQKGPIGKVFRTKTRKEFEFRAGGRITGSFLPDAALARISNGNGAGDLWLQRITDGTEKKSSLVLTNRRGTRSAVLNIFAGNGGRWAGKKQTLIDEYDTITANTMQLTTVPSSLKEDELAGAFVSFHAIPGKSYKVIGNDELGMLYFDVDVDLVTDIGASTDKLIAVKLENDGYAIAVRVEPGTLNPSTEVNMIVSFLEGNILTEQKRYNNLSMDSTAGNYLEKVINDDPDKDFLITVEDLNLGSITADIRPANYAGQIVSLTATVLTAKVWDEVVNSVAGATGTLSSFVTGADIIPDKVTLTCTTQGSRATVGLSFGAVPDDGDAIVIDGVTYTFKTAVVDADTQILIGGTIEATVDNAVAFLTSKALTTFPEKSGTSAIDIYANTAGVLGNSITTVSTGGANKPTFGGAVLAGGVNQTWSVASEKMPFLTMPTATSGVAYTAVNDYSFGFTFVDTTKDSTKEFDVGDTVDIYARPFEPEALVGGYVRPKESEPREKFEIISNDADSITVRAGSDMTAISAADESFNVSYNQQMSGGYDGVTGITDVTYTTAYDTGTSPLRALRGKNLGLIKLATPGVNAVAVQKAGAAFAESQNWQYRLEVPANIITEVAADAYLDGQVGRNDFTVVSFPSYGYISNPAGSGKKLIPMTGSIQGVEAKIAKDYDGYHKAGAGTTAILPDIIELPGGLGDEVSIDEEFLNPLGINVVKKSSGNFILWGDRMFGLDTSFKFKHQREYVSHVENTFLENFDFIIFALNNAETQNQLISTFIQFFTPEFAKGAIVGDSLQDAVIIKIDEENNTPATRANGDLNAEIGMRVVDTVERFIITVSKLGITEAA